MRVQKYSLGVLALAIVGLALLAAPSPERIATTPPAPAPTSYPDIPAIFQPRGQVAANDETFGSTPYRAPDVVPDSAPVRTSTPTKVASATPKPLTRTDFVPAEGTLITIDEVQYPLRKYKALLTPNDPTANQWWVTNAKIDQAWDVPMGANQTTLAVIDTGFGLQHEEFTDRWYSNPGESGAAVSEAASQLNCTDRGLSLNANCNLVDDNADGIVDNETGTLTYQNASRLNCTAQGKAITKDCNRVDDDDNGFVDDVSGWDFSNMDNKPQAGELSPFGTGTTHGTETAGVAAANGNNGLGIAGVDWQTRIMPIQALDDDSYGDTFGVGRAIMYAADLDADVISISLGSVLPDDYVRYAVNYAIAQGSVVVASAGNDGCNCMVYPANYPETIAVGALETDNTLASFSSYGSNLDILAPGTSIRTPVWMAGNNISGYANNVAGTSFSAPMVSGLMTRMLSQKPSLTPLQLVAAITENTNRLALTSGQSRSTQLGYGTIDASAATNRITTPRVNARTYQLTPVSLGQQLFPLEPSEVAGTYLVQSCANNRPGSTPVFQLSKGNSHVYTVSQAEAYMAQLDGWRTQLVTEACLSQPGDTPGSIRRLSIPKEYRDIYENVVD